MKHLIILSVLMWCSFSAVFAQIKVEVIVLDENDAPVPYVTVYNRNAKQSVMTNEDGRFEMNCRTNDGIVVRRLGYQEYQNTAGELQNAGKVTLKEAIVDKNEVSNDAKVIVRKFLDRIPKNYTANAAIISGIYQDCTYIENECYGFFHSDMDIFVDHITSRSFPTYQTKIYRIKISKHPDREGAEASSSAFFYSQLWLFRHSFLWNLTRTQYRNMGTITYDGSKLVMIAFQPDQIEKSERQYTGSMYIDMKTYALVFLHYEMLPNEIDFTPEARRYKMIKDETKVMFEKYKGKYYPAFTVSDATTLGFWNEWEIANTNHKDTFNMESVTKFFAREIKTKTKGFVADCRFFHELNPEIITPVDQEDYKTTDYIMETEREKQLIKRYGVVKR